mgnify:FL=1
MDLFGWHLALNSSGSRLVVGGSSEDGSGAAYVFAFEGLGGGQLSVVKASNSDEGDAFPEDLALSGDGSVLVVGADHEDSAATGINGDQSDNSAVNSGAVYDY